MSYQFTAGRFKGFAADGAPLAGGRLYTFASGTTTFKAAYTDSTLGTPCTYVNDGTGALYIALDARGEAQLWLGSGAYSFALKTSAGAGVWTVDGVTDTAGGLLADLASTSTGKGSKLIAWIRRALGAVGRTVEDKLTEQISVFDFMTPAQIADVQAGTLSIDCYDAIVKAITAAITGSGAYYRTSPSVYFPPGKYKVSQTITLTNQVRMWGDGSGLGYAICPQLMFTTPGGTGFHASPYHIGTAANGAILEGLQITGTTGTADALGGHGVLMRAPIQIRNCQINNFTTDNISIVADSGGTGLALGNANGWSLRDITIWGSGRHAVFVQGGDANAGLAIAVNVAGSGNCGIFDNSFLGNTWIGCEVANTVGPAYKTTGPNTSSLFLGCYQEGDAGASSIVSPSIVIGGIFGTGASSKDQVIGSALAIGGGNGGGRSTSMQYFSPNGTSCIQIGSGFTSSNNCLMGLQDKNELGGGGVFRLQNNPGHFWWDWAGQEAPILEFTNSQATVANGFPRDAYARFGGGGIAMRQGMMIGAGLTYVNTGPNADPTSGTYVVTDTIINNAPASGAYWGRVCTVKGTQGTLSGVTGTMTAGSPAMTVNTTTGLGVGMFVSVAGGPAITRAQVLSIVGLVVTLDTNAAANGSAVAVSYANATFKTFGLIS
jgi:hypothetical protein